MKSNAIAILVRFVVIYHWLVIKPSLRVLSRLVVVKVNLTEPHIHFQMVEKFRLIVGLPDSHKDWKKMFVWIVGHDLELGCPNWLEIRREMFMEGELLEAERDALDQIKAYAGSHRVDHLLDSSVLQVVGVSVVPPSAQDKERASSLIFGNGEGTMVLTAPSTDSQAGSSARPTKHLCRDIPPREGEGVEEEPELPSLIHKRRRRP